MRAVWLEHEGEVLPDELGARDAAVAGGAREQLIILRVERNCDRLLPRKGLELICLDK
jgi:hypothetical protein